MILDTLKSGDQNLLLEIDKELSKIENLKELYKWFNCFGSDNIMYERLKNSDIDDWEYKLFSMHEIRSQQIKFKEKYPDSSELYNEVILNRNPKLLISKTKYKIDELSKLFKIKNLDIFIQFVNSMSVIRSDENQYTEYLSPSITGNNNNYIGDRDGFIKAENYIYASFDGIAHVNTHHGLIEDNGRINNWSDELKKSINIRELNQGDIENNSEIIFNDLLFIGGFLGLDEDNLEIYKIYLENCFDYENGKRLLAIYLSIVFNTTNEAIEYFSGNYGMFDIKNWKNFHDKKFSEINRRINCIYKETGLMPPCQLEVRIHNKVRVKNTPQETLESTLIKADEILRK